VDFVVRDVLGHHGAGTHDGTVADSNARHEGRPVADPYVIADYGLEGAPDGRRRSSVCLVCR
jgi:hypothetical protein